MTHDELRKLAEAASFGEWQEDDGFIHAAVAVKPNGYVAWIGPYEGTDDEDLGQMTANAEYIAAANPKQVIALLDEIVKLQDKVHDLERQSTINQHVLDGSATLIEKNADQTNKLLAELEECKADALRYRWLRHRTSAHGVIDGWAFSFPSYLSLPAPFAAMKDPGLGLDIAIDAAMRPDNQEVK